jgi:hypothetical protein
MHLNARWLTASCYLISRCEVDCFWHCWGLLLRRRPSFSLANFKAKYCFTSMFITESIISNYAPTVFGQNNKQCEVANFQQTQTSSSCKGLSTVKYKALYNPATITMFVLNVRSLAKSSDNYIGTGTTKLLRLRDVATSNSNSNKQQ